ncbi:MAG: YggS family pyridoxal phosphate-dependent enzyme [Longimicrobiales bacterium]
MDEARLREQLARVEEYIERARQKVGRREPVLIVAVTKGHSVQVVQSALSVGLTRIGENRVPELEEKIGEQGRGAAEWHLIGHLQRNKVRRALPLFDLFHAIDSERLAGELSAEAQRTGGKARGLIQVNASGEGTKGGFDALQETETLLDQIARVAALPALEVLGLMTMAPFTADQAVQRETFRRTRSLFEQCAAQVAGFQARHLSMGMSNDFEVAVEEGSTMVRLGTILFGERET